MTSPSLHDIRKELQTLDATTLGDLCARLARYKKENKEFLAYLLFDAHDEQAYAGQVKDAMAGMFQDLPSGNLYYIKKSVRKILRFVNRQIKYSGVRTTEVELRLAFCHHIKAAGIALPEGTVLANLYQRQVTLIGKTVARLPDDVRTDYQRDVDIL